MLKRLALVAFTLLLAVPVAAAATAEYKPEQERLKPADVKLAKKVALKRADLGRGWTAFRSDDTSGEDDETFASCEGFEVDLSAFTITGRASSAFRNAQGASITSTVEVYPSRAQAAGDFATATGHPMLIQCMRAALEQSLAEEQLEPGMTMRLVSFDRVPAPRVGQLAFMYRVHLKVGIEGTEVDVFFDGLGFQKGRTVAGLVFINALKPFPNEAAIARKVAARMR